MKFTLFQKIKICSAQINSKAVVSRLPGYVTCSSNRVDLHNYSSESLFQVINSYFRGNRILESSELS